MFTYLLVALGLSMDAFAVSVASGICIADLELGYALRAAGAFGLFQFAMPILGWLAGSTFRSAIEGFDHWVAFGLLVVVGGKMVVESFKARDCPASEGERKESGIRNLRTLFVLAVATSIDALAVGLSYSMLDTPILLPAAVIGVVTFFLCLLGCEFGKKLGARFERWATLVGGIVLVGIGAKILIEHVA